MTTFTDRPSEMDEDRFMARFADIYEHSAWVAERVWAKGLTDKMDEVENLHAAMVDTLSEASRGAQLALIRAHPDLAGKAALRGELTDASTSEQAGAGLDTLTADEMTRFTELNDAYKAKFDFPFIKAVKKSNKMEILAAFEERLPNTPEQEFEAAIAEINKIALFRLMEL